MPAHHQPQRSRGEHAAASPRRPCRKASLILQPVRHITLDQDHEESALAAFANLLAPYTDQRDREAA